MLRRRSGIVAVVTTAALCALGLGGEAPASVKPPLTGATSASKAPAAEQVTLVTGDVVTVATSPAGRQTATLAPGRGSKPGAPFQTFNRGGHLYVVPQSAARYAGTRIGIELFDVTARAQHPSQPTRVRLRYRSQKSPSHVPGVRITHRAGQTAHGVITRKSSKALGRALARRASLDEPHGRTTSGPLAQVVHIGAAGASSPPTVRPDFPMRTLTIRGVDAAGKKANVAVHLYNVDDLRKYQETVQVHHGLAKASVPVGHYAAWAFFWDSGAHTLHEVMVPQFTVRADRAIRLDARDATSRVSMQTPKPADPAINAIGVGRTDSTGETAVWTFNGTGALTFYTQPVRHGVSVGQLHYYAYSRLYSPESAGSAYTYDLMFPSDGTIAADQHYVVHEADLASVDAQYPATHTGQTGEDSRFGVLPWQAYGTTRPEPIDTPTQRTEYYSAHPDVSWEASYWQVYRSSPYTIQGLYMSAWHTYQPGTRAATAWGDQPQHPQMLQGPLFVGETICPACIGGSTLHLLVYPYGGNSPWHRGSSSGSDTGLDQSISYAVYADDVPVEESQGMVDTTVTAPADARRYRIDYHVHRASAEFTQSTDVRTRWTVRAAARRGDLSPGWSCTLAQSTDCKVLALMTSDYRLPVDMLGRVRSGKATGEVRIGHLRGLAGIGVTSLKVRVTFDSGDHWRRVQVDRRAPGRYGIAFKVPKAGRTNGFGGLRIRARDAAGGTLRQTIQHAFSVVAR